LFYEPIQTLNQKQSYLRRTNIPNNLLLEFRLDYLEGVPLPNKPELILTRKMHMTLYDRVTDTFLGSSCVVYAKWTAEYSDRWYFNMTKVANEINFYLR